MTDRDFKLLVREYFQAKSRANYSTIYHERASIEKAWDVANDLEKRYPLRTREVYSKGCRRITF